MGEYPTDLRIRRYPDPCLRQVSEPVTVFDDDLRAFTTRMFELMDADRGVGLAAPQVGVSRRILVTDHTANKELRGLDRRVWINLRFENLSGETTWEEGCLSVPGIWSKVIRANALEASWQDEQGAPHRARFDHAAGDFLAIVLQHEADHLDGRLFIDHLTPAQLSLQRKRLRDLERDYQTLTGQRGAVLRR